MHSPRWLVLAVVLLLGACRFDLTRALGPGDLRGRLVTLAADGTRVAASGARIAVRNAPIAVTSDSTGRFVVRALPPGRYDLSITHTTDAGPLALSLRGLSLVEVGNGRADGRDLGELVLGAFGGLDVTLAGTVAADARVVLDGVGEGRIQGNSVRFEGLAPGPYVVSGLAGGGVVKSVEVEVERGASATTTLDFGAPALLTGTLTGHVRTGGNLAPDLVSISVVGSGLSPLYAGLDGTFVVGRLTSGIYSILFEAPDALPTQVPFVVVAGDTELGDVLVLPADTDCANGGTGFGTAEDRDADGTPDADEPPACRCRPGTTDTGMNGLCDDAESTPPDAEPDADHDGIPDDADSCPDTPDLGVDADGDGLDDACDPLLDSDGDGVADAWDDCPGERDSGTDGDGDGVDDTCDRCPGVLDPPDGPCPGSATWGLSFVTGSDAEWHAGAGVWLAETGVTHRVQVVLPGGFTGELRLQSVGVPVAKVEPVAGQPTQFDVTVPWVGTATLSATLLFGEGSEEKRMRVLGVLDRAKAVFVDPAAVASGTGTLEAPLPDPVAAINAVGPATAKRHFYVRAGSYANESGVQVNTDGAHDRGTERLFVFGGFDASWGRDPTESRSDFRRSSGEAFTVGATPAKGALWLDGIALTNQGGVRCDGAELVVAQSYVNASLGSAVAATGCTGLLVNSVLLTNSSSATVSWQSADASPSKLRLFDSTVIYVGASAGTVNSGGYIGGEVVGNLFYDAGTFPYGNVPRVLEDNVWALPSAGQSAAQDTQLNELSHGVLALYGNVASQGCAPGTDGGSDLDVSPLVAIGRYPIGTADACRATGPIPSPADAQEAAVLRLDRKLALRHPDARQRGSDERSDTDGDGADDVVDHCPVDASRSPVGACPVPDMDFLPTGQPKLAVLQNGTTQLSPGHRIPEVTYSYESRDPSVATVDASGVVTGVGVGAGIIDVIATDPATNRSLQRSVHVDVRPRGRTYFVDLRASVAGGTGTESFPMEVWPDVQTLVSGSGGAAINLLVAEIRSFEGQLMPMNWLPPGARVFGGYVRGPGGFERRLAVAETNLQPARNLGGALELAPGSPGDPAWKRVLDGVTVGSNGTTTDAALRVAGPALLNRVRVIQGYSQAPTALELGTGNVSVVSSSVSFPTTSMGAYSLVDIVPNAAPLVYSSDFSRTYGQSGAAAATAVAPVFRVKGGAGTIQGAYLANRTWVENVGSSRYAFFDAGASGVVTPATCFANWAGPVAAGFFSVWQGTVGGAFSGLDTLATGNPVPLSSNVVSDAAKAEPYGFLTLPTLPPLSMQFQGDDVVARAKAIDAAAPATNWGRLPLDRDLRDRFRPASGSDVGAQEVDFDGGS